MIIPCAECGITLGKGEGRYDFYGPWLCRPCKAREDEDFHAFIYGPQYGVWRAYRETQGALDADERKAEEWREKTRKN